MKRLSSLLAVVAVLAIGCASSPSSPSDAKDLLFTAQLRPGNETPPVTNSESTSSGTATVNFSVTKDNSGAITAATVNFRVTLTGFPASTTVTGADIRSGATGVAGPVVVATIVIPGEVVLTNGAGTVARQVVAVSPANAQAIVDNPANFYFNVYTTLNAGGVMRGQLAKS